MNSRFALTHADIDSLLEVPISQSSAQQRTGRCGREQAGSCFRLYTESFYESMPSSQVPEIQRCSLTFAILHLLAAGQQDINSFDFLDAPEPAALSIAQMDLFAIGALDESLRLTEAGRKMALFPLEPRYARILLASFDHGCPSDIIDILSALFAENLVLSPAAKREEASEKQKIFHHRHGDHLMLLNVVRAYESLPTSERARWAQEHFISQKALNSMERIRKQLRTRCERLELDWRPSCGDETDGILLSCATGLASSTAIRQPDGKYQTTAGHVSVWLHPSSCLHGRAPPMIMYNELIFTNRPYVRFVSAIRPSYVKEVAPQVFGRRSM